MSKILVMAGNYQEYRSYLSVRHLNPRICEYVDDFSVLYGVSPCTIYCYGTSPTSSKALAAREVARERGFKLVYATDDTGPIGCIWCGRLEEEHWGGTHQFGDK